MNGPWTVLVLVQAVGLLCVAQPWNETWRDAGLALFAIEALLFAVLFLPVFLFQRLHRRRPTREAARVTVDVLLGLLPGLVP